MMKKARRDFLKISGMAALAGVGGGLFSCKNNNAEGREHALAGVGGGGVTWANVRKSFSLDPGLIHMSCLLLASHPRPVQEAIERYRKGLDDNPVDYLHEQYSDLPKNLRNEAAAYMNVQPDEIAVTDSTTMGTALLMNGLHIRPGQEMLSATHDYPATHRAIEYATAKNGAAFRTFSLYDDIFTVTADEMVDKFIQAIRPETRLVTGTWVHSSTGLKIPVKQMAQRLQTLNEGRSPDDRVLFFVDGVHGFGVENEAIGDLGCDFFSAGTHKWLFGPRGTGLFWGRTDVHGQVSPTIPSFTRTAAWGGLMSPGGFKPFEHQWAIIEAFRFHLKLGPKSVAQHIHQLASQLKEGLSKMDNVVLYTPLDEDLSAGIVCFDIKGLSPPSVVRQLAQQGIVASTTPYSTSYARLTPGVYNTSEEVEAVLRAIRAVS